MRIGIDIGTHRARAAYLDDQGRARLIRFTDGSTTLPAFVRQTMRGLTVGHDAAQALAGNRETTVCGVTRILGRASLLPDDVRSRLPFDVREEGGEWVCNLLYAEARPAELFGLLGRELVFAAEQALGEPVEGVALAVPATAEDRYRVQARAALEAQGIQVLRLVNHPAAVLAASPLAALSINACVAVVYCGDGSTDVSIARREGTGSRILATAGDAWLGGDDLAWTVAAGLNERFCATAGVDVFAADDGRLAAHGLRHAAEDALHTLRHAMQASITLDHGAGFGRDLATVLTRTQADEWLAPSMRRVGDLCRHALQQSRLSAGEIDAVLLVGDWADLPALRETVADAFERPVGLLHSDHAAELAAFGAALAANTRGNLIWDVTPYALGINCYYGDAELFSPILLPNTPIPTPPYGAGGAFTEKYETRFPDQTSVTLDVLQYRGPRNSIPFAGVGVRPNECEVLGSWRFDGLQPKRGKRAAFTVTFAVDESGILELIARETLTGRTLTARVDRTIG